MQGSDPDSLYRLSSRSSTGSSSNKSTNNPTKFWKAGSQSPITSIPRTRGNQLHRFLKIFWRFSKWPIGLLILCCLLGIVVYFVVLASRDTYSLVNSESNSLLENDLSIDFDSYNDVDERSSTHLPPIINGHAAQYPIKRMNESQTSVTGTTSTTMGSTRRLSTTQIPTTMSQNEQETPAIVTQVLESSTFRSNLFDSIKTTILSPAKVNVINDDQQTQRPKITKMKKVNVASTPTDTMRTQFGFTSGHQNNFGIPIEEDERILKMLDEELLKKTETQVNFREFLAFKGNLLQDTIDIDD